MRLSLIFFLGLCLPNILAAQTNRQRLSDELFKRSTGLGVSIKEFPKPQGTGGFDEIPSDSPILRFKVLRRPLSGPTPDPSFEKRELVKAKDENGSLVEGFCGRFDRRILWPPLGTDSSNQNTAQAYETHLGYGYNPPDVFIGSRERGRIRTTLFFRDVGSHDTAPHYISLDSEGKVHLIVSDVNISDNNELNVYSAKGDPRTGKWLEAWLIDRRGFTSWSRPWNGRWQRSIHSLWSWGDASFRLEDPTMGLFYVENTPSGFGRKIRVFGGLVENYDASIDKKTGDLLVSAALEDGVFVALRNSRGVWSKPTLLDKSLDRRYDVSVSALGGSFVIRTSKPGAGEFVLVVR